MKYRIFTLEVAFLPEHLQWQSPPGPAYGYTTEESLEKAMNLLQQQSAGDKLTIQRFREHTDYQTTAEIGNPEMKRILAHLVPGTCVIAPFSVP
ncbi:MAG: hypothetical protein ACHQ5A_10915 [Opitutales bacterium]